jgi:hypothetical protein
MAVDMNKLVNLDRLKEFQTSENASTASEFSTSKSYAAGAYVYYKGKLYKFKSAHAAGAWTTTDVEETKLADDVSSLKESISDNDAIIFNDAVTDDRLSYNSAKADNTLKRVMAIIPPNTVVTECKQMLTGEGLTYVALEVYEWSDADEAYVYNRSIASKSSTKSGNYYVHDYGSITTRKGCLLTFSDTTSSGWLRGQPTG